MGVDHNHDATWAIAMSIGHWWDGLDRVWKVLTSMAAALLVAGSVGWTANDLLDERARLVPRVSAVEDSIGVLRVKVADVEVDLTRETAENRDRITDIRRLLSWQICSRDPRPEPQVLAALNIQCSFPQGG